MLFAAAAGCQREPAASAPGAVDPGGGSSDDVVLIQAELTGVPTNAKCVRFTTVAPSRTFQQSFLVTPGDAGTTLGLTGLPYNQALTITAEAFNVTACTSVTATTPVTYASDPVSAGPLAPGDSQMLSFVLKPTSNASGTVDFLYLTLSPPGAGYLPTLIAQQSAAIPFTVMNIGAVPTSALTWSISGTPAQFTIVSNPCPATLATRQSCTFQVAFTPTMPGPQSATLTVSAAQGGTVTAMLNGLAQNPARLVTTTPSLSFPAVLLTTSATMGITVTNSNGGSEQPTGPITATVMGSPDLHVQNGCAGIGGSGQMCSIGIQYLPTTVGVIPPGTTITVMANPGGMVVVGVSGSGISPLSFTSPPSPVDFGTVPITSMTGSSRTFILKNSGLSPSSPLSIASSMPAIFRLPTPNPCSGLMLAPGATCSMTVTFLPNLVTTFSGTLTASTVQNGWSATSMLTGTGM